MLEDINTHEPTTARKDMWYKQTGVPFSPIASAAVTETHSYKCPRCLQPVITRMFAHKLASLLSTYTKFPSSPYSG